MHVSNCGGVKFCTYDVRLLDHLAGLCEVRVRNLCWTIK